MTRQESFADKALQWKLAAEEKAEATQETKEEDEAVEKGDDEVDDETAEKRDLAKARKFKRLSDAGAIPDHIYEALEKTKTRSAQTALINQPEKPVFEVTKSAKHQKYGKDETIGVPRCCTGTSGARSWLCLLPLPKAQCWCGCRMGSSLQAIAKPSPGFARRLTKKTRSRVVRRRSARTPIKA